MTTEKNPLAVALGRLAKGKKKTMTDRGRRACRSNAQRARDVLARMREASHED